MVQFGYFSGVNFNVLSAGANEILQKLINDNKATGIINVRWDLFNWNTLDAQQRFYYSLDSFFQDTDFNEYIGSWNITGAQYMAKMFQRNEVYNQDMTNWNVSGAIQLSEIFDGCTAFNGDISNWDTGACTTMYRMFNNCSNFNKPVRFDTKNVIHMGSMFNNCSNFNQDISWNSAQPDIWRVNNVSDFYNFLSGTTSFSTTNYDKFLIGLKAQDDAGYTLPTGIVINGPETTQYGADPDAVTAHNFLTSTKGWTIYDGGAI